MAPELPSPVAVVCHDAGATNLILPWLDQAIDIRPVMRGPAEGLWRARFGDRPLCDSVDEALNGARLLLSGTGWASALEHEARIRAAAQGIYSAAVIDHWVNYPQRFQRDGLCRWPDEFWVTDPEALALARAHFPGACLRQFDNRYLAEQVSLIARPATAQGDVLYVMEPMRSTWGAADTGPMSEGEWQALRYFLANRDALHIVPGTPVRLRPHPSDPIGKYDNWLASTEAIGVTLDPHPTLAQAMAGATWVVGCESMALVVALASGRQVASTLPPWAPNCRLPHAGLSHLRLLTV